MGDASINFFWALRRCAALYSSLTPVSTEKLAENGGRKPRDRLGDDSWTENKLYRIT